MCCPKWFCSLCQLALLRLGLVRLLLLLVRLPLLLLQLCPWPLLPGCLLLFGLPSL